MFDYQKQAIDEKVVHFKNDHFMYIQPSSHLQSILSQYKLYFPYMLPDGCYYRILPTFSASVVIARTEDAWICKFWGPISKQREFTEEEIAYKFMIVLEFKPAGFYGIYPNSQKELLDQRYSLDILLPELSKELLQIVVESATINELVAKSEQLIDSKRTTDPIYENILNTIDNIMTKDEKLDIQDIINELHYSHRHLNRLFYQYVGSSIKEFLKITRLNKTILQMNQTNANLAEISSTSGYYDQAHLCKEFKDIAKTSPLAYRQTTCKFYNDFIKYDNTF